MYYYLCFAIAVSYDNKTILTRCSTIHLSIFILFDNRYENFTKSCSVYENHLSLSVYNGCTVDLKQTFRTFKMA